MKISRSSKGFYDIMGIDMRSVTTVLSILEKNGLHPWIAATAANKVVDSLVAPLISGDMSIQQLSETDLRAVVDSAVKEHQRLRTEAKGIGSQVHKIIEEYYASFLVSPSKAISLLDSYTKMMPEMTSPILAFLEWDKSFGIVPISVEHTVFHSKYFYAGTLDLECYANLSGADERQKIIVDFKAASGFYDDYILQVAAYLYADGDVVKMDGCDSDSFTAYRCKKNENRGVGAMVVRLDKETGIPESRYYSIADLALPFLMFCDLKAYYDHKDAWSAEKSKRKAKAGPAGRPGFSLGPDGLFHINMADGGDVKT